jgi:hypothetical protein
VRNRTAEEHIPRSVVIEDLPESRPAHEHHEDFHRRDPGHGARGILGELMSLIILLKDADAIDPSETAKEATPCSEHNEPCFEATIREVGGCRCSRKRRLLRCQVVLLQVSLGSDSRFGKNVSQGLLVLRFQAFQRMASWIVIAVRHSIGGIVHLFSVYRGRC